METARILIAVEDEVLVDELARSLDDLPSLGLYEAVSSTEEALAAGDEAFLLIDGPTALALARRRPSPLPATTFLVGRSFEPDELRAAVSIGARGTALWPDEAPELFQTLSSAMRAASARRSSGKVTSVWSPKGGSGTSLLAAHLAAALAEMSQRTILVDLDLAHADQRQLLGAGEHSGGVLDLVRVASEVTGEVIESVAERHPMGFQAIHAPGSPGEAELVKPSDLRSVLLAVSETYPQVVVDVPSGGHELVATAGEVSDSLVVLVTPDVLSLRRSRDGLRGLRDAGVPQERVVLVFNRSAGKPITVKDVEAVTGHQVAFEVRWDREFENAADRGELSAAGIGSLSGLARRVAGLPEPAPRGLMDTLRRRG